MTDIDLTAPKNAAREALETNTTWSPMHCVDVIVDAALPHILAQVEARVKPTREDTARALWNAQRPAFPWSWDEIAEASENRPYPEYPHIYDDYMALADRVLALLPGRTEAEVREQVAQELLSDASGRPFPHAYVRLMNPLKGEHPVRTFRAAVEILARGIARGGERS